MISTVTTTSISSCITMQGESNQIIANIRYVENETAAKLRKEELRKPFRIIVTKSDVYIHYPLVYLGVSLKFYVTVNFLYGVSYTVCE